MATLTNNPIASPSAASGPVADAAIPPPDPTNPAVPCQSGPCCTSVNAHTSSEGVDKSQEHPTAPQSAPFFPPTDNAVRTETSGAVPPSHGSLHPGVTTVPVELPFAIPASTNLPEQHNPSGNGAPVAAVSPPIPTYPGKPAGWAAVEEALTKFDQQEIGGYKEDVDTLLTFTGLYSAVLTAFVIVSYPQLQEDTAGETLQVLRIIASQTAAYALVGGQLLNSTTASPAPSPPFQPSPTAIRVNALWFSSLVISLSTASLGILVKQWLREYMAFCTSSPQGQLRVRQFRRSGLESWHVFGIASLLPLLIQISLSLFFVGLCYFTIDIHPTIGWTTIPLVCVWALFIAIVTLSPIFSSRCPYKTPALAVVTSLLRTRVYLPLAYILMKYVVPVMRRLLLVTPFLIFWAIVFPILWLFHTLSCQLEVTGELFWTVCKVFMLDLNAAVDHPSFTASTEEAEVIRDASKDLDILVSADALQVNDELLGTTMKVALEQSTPSFEDVVSFLVKIVGNRVPWTDNLSDSATLVDCTSLSIHARTAVQNLIDSHVASSIEKLEGRVLSKSAMWAMCLSVSLYEPGAQIPTNQGRFVISWFRTEVRRARGHGTVEDWDFWQQMLPLVCQLCRQQEELGFREKVDFVEHTFSMLPFQDWPDMIPDDSARVSRSVVEETAHYFMDVLRSDGDSLFGDDCVLALAIAIKLCAIADVDPALSRSWADQLFQSSSTPAKMCMNAVDQALDSWFWHPPTFILKHMRTFVEASLQYTRSDTIDEVPESLRANIRRISRSIIQSCDSDHNVDYDRVGLDFAYLCYFALHIRRAYVQPNTIQHHNEALNHEWRYTFDLLAGTRHSIVLSYVRHGRSAHIASDDKLRELHEECWDLIDRIDDESRVPSIDTTRQYDDWIETFEEKNSAVGDYFCLMLNAIQEAPTRRRMRRLNAMTSEQREAIEASGRREISAVHGWVQD